MAIRNLREGPISFPCFTFSEPEPMVKGADKPEKIHGEPHTSAKVPASRISRRLSGAPETLNPNPTNRDVLTVCDQCTARAFGWHWPIFDGIVICHPRVLSWRPLLTPRKVAVRVAVVGEPTTKERIGLPLLLTQPKLYPL